MTAKAPNGLRILGTKEIISGRAEISDGSYKRDADGNLTYDYAGETEIFWDEQKTVEQDGKEVFLDEDGGEWTADQITLEEDEDE
jgi:hypothetical protein